MLVLDHPEVGTRRCTDCKKWLYDEDTGVRKKDRNGKPIIRPDYAPVRCETKKGCPRGKPENEMRQYNWRAYMHYLECKAVGEWPADPIVRANASVIRTIEDNNTRNAQRRSYTAMESLSRMLEAWATAMAASRTR